MQANVEATQRDGEASVVRLATRVVADQTTGGLPVCRLRRVAQYVQDNLHRELRLAELSGLVHMSPFHFARLFKQSTGVSPIGSWFSGGSSRRERCSRLGRCRSPRSHGQ